MNNLLRRIGVKWRKRQLSYDSMKGILGCVLFVLEVSVNWELRISPSENFRSEVLEHEDALNNSSFLALSAEDFFNVHR